MHSATSDWGAEDFLGDGWYGSSHTLEAWHAVSHQILYADALILNGIPAEILTTIGALSGVPIVIENHVKR